MKKIKTYWNSLSETMMITKKEHCLLLVISVLAGCIIGMLISPRKTICCGNGNGGEHHYYGPSGDDQDFEE